MPGQRNFPSDRYRRERRIMTLGREAACAIESRKRRLQRAAASIRAGRPVIYQNLAHPPTCPCYDCLYGEVAEARERVRYPSRPVEADVRLYQAENFCYAKRGKMAARLPRLSAA